MASQGALQQQTAVLDGHLYKLRCYKDPSRIKRDVLECISRYPSLEPNSGVLASLPSPNPILYLHGTVPIFFNRQSYNIPVAIWVVESYPFAAPMVLVKPTTDMIIKPRHKHVDSQGITYLPYLSSWSPNTCNILGLVEVLAVTFSQDPPVRSTPPPAASPSRNPPSAYPNNSSGGYPNNSYPNNSSSSYPNNSYPNNANPNSYPNSYPNPSSSSYPNSNPGYPNSYPNNSNNNGYPNSYPNPNSFNSSEGASMAGSLTGSVIPGGPNNLYGSSYGNYPPSSQPPNGNYPPYGVQSSTGPNSYPNSGSNPYPNYGPNSGPYPPNNLSSSSLSSSNLNSSGGFPNPQPPAYSNGPSKPMGGVPSPFGNFNPSPQSSTSSYGG